MALYKSRDFLWQFYDPAFDEIVDPGSQAPRSGIYRCEGCGHEIAANRGDSMPAQNHHRHLTYLGPIRWRLIVSTAH
jgi:hypothetical protein